MPDFKAQREVLHVHLTAVTRALQNVLSIDISDLTILMILVQYFCDLVSITSFSKEYLFFLSFAVQVDIRCEPLPQELQVPSSVRQQFKLKSATFTVSSKYRCDIHGTTATVSIDQ